MNEPATSGLHGADGGVALVVVGCHRSGTSALAGALGLGAGYVADDVLAAHPQHNARGFWESRAVVHLNDDILKSRGGSWDSPPPVPSDPSPPELVARAQAVLAQHFDPAAPLIVLKDPRISLLIPLWRDALARLGRRTVFLVMVRQPAEVAASLHHRNAFDAARGLALWRRYVQRAECDTRDHERVVVTYDALLADWRSAFERIGAQAGVGLVASADEQEAINGFLSAELRHHRSGFDEIGDGASALADLYNALAQEAGCRTPTVARLDAAWSALPPPPARGADGWDVRCGYNLFLGREPETPKSVSAKIGLPIATFVQKFVSSGEWIVRLRDRLCAGAKPRGGLFDRSPAPVLARWAAERLPLTREGRVQVAGAERWIDLFEGVLGDPDFQACIGSDSPAAEPGFLANLHALAKAPMPFLASASSGLRWTLVTGAARSGTSLLRAMIHEHPHAALLQEYGLTALVERIEAIVARHPARTEDWERPVEQADPDFGAVAAFYRERPGRDAVTRGGGDLNRTHFHVVAAGLFATLAPGKSLRIVGDKVPMSSAAWEDVSFLADVLPGFAVFIILRNPAEVVKSSLIRREAARRGRDDWPVETVQEAVAEWIAAWRLTQRLVRDHPDIVHVLKYEELCAAPAKVMGAVYGCLGLPAHTPTTPVNALPAGLRLHSVDEDAAINRLLGPIIAAWPDHDGYALLDAFADAPLPYIFGRTIDLRSADADRHLIDGFSFREDWGRWTEGPEARIELLQGEADGAVLIELSVARAFVGDGGVCDLMIQAGTGETHLFQIDDGPRVLQVEGRLDRAATTGILVVTLTIARPKTANRGDRRRIGVGLKSVKVSRTIG